MRRSPRAVAALAILGSALAVAACHKDPFGGAPQRVQTHGYRARGIVKENGAEKARFELAARGRDVLREDKGGVLLLKGDEKKAYRLDPATKTVREVPFAEASRDIVPGMPGYPVFPGFDERVEAQRRGLTEYHRESDEVFAGHACALWRFDDAPNDVTSPTTTYWVAKDLDNLVIWMVREVPRPGADPSRTAAELVDVRVGTDAAAFAVPAGYKNAP